jgi:hypothetical protein
MFAVVPRRASQGEERSRRAGGARGKKNGWERDRRNEMNRGKGRFSQLEYFRS